MKPSKFKLANKVLTKPETMTDQECKPMNVYTDGQQCISCWKGTFLDRIKFLFTGRVWVSVYSGKTQPPIWAVINYPFIGDGQK